MLNRIGTSLRYYCTGLNVEPRTQLNMSISSGVFVVYLTICKSFYHDFRIADVEYTSVKWATSIKFALDKKQLDLEYHLFMIRVILIVSQ